MIDVGDTHPRTGHRWRSRWLLLAVPAVGPVAGGAVAAVLVLREQVRSTSSSETIIDTVEYYEDYEDYEIAVMSSEPQR